jgi:hypothetical protein
MDEKLEELYRKLDSLKELEHDWDSYGADPISVDAIESAKAALKEIFERTGFVPDYVVPCPDSGVQFEYHRADKMGGTEIEIENNGVDYSLFLPNEKEFEKITLDDVCRIIAGTMEKVGFKPNPDTSK